MEILNNSARFYLKSYKTMIQDCSQRKRDQFWSKCFLFKELLKKKNPSKLAGLIFNVITFSKACNNHDWFYHVLPKVLTDVNKCHESLKKKIKKLLFQLFDRWSCLQNIGQYSTCIVDNNNDIEWLSAIVGSKTPNDLPLTLLLICTLTYLSD